MTNIIRAICLMLATSFAFALHAEETERFGKQKVVYHINYNGGEAPKRIWGPCATFRTTSMPSGPRIST